MANRELPFPVCELSGNLINYAVVDAFTDTPFRGNPAAVCLLPAWQEAHWMQQVASEFNLSLTVFLVRRLAGNDNATKIDDFEIRWFTPCSEVFLCGHATLASAYLLFAFGNTNGDSLRFHSQKSGVLIARKVQRLSKGNDRECKFVVELDFPMLLCSECDSELELLSSTFKDLTPLSFSKTSNNDLLVELPSGEDVHDLQPSFDELRKLTARGVIVTGQASHNSGYDFISRFFAPKVGLDEDPVCGQAHCALAAFWARKLNKENLIAYQASERGGVLHLKVDFEASRVYLRGEAVHVMSGVLLNQYGEKNHV